MAGVWLKFQHTVVNVGDLQLLKRKSDFMAYPNRFEFAVISCITMVYLVFCLLNANQPLLTAEMEYQPQSNENLAG